METKKIFSVFLIFLFLRNRGLLLRPWLINYKIIGLVKSNIINYFLFFKRKIILSIQTYNKWIIEDTNS